MKLKVLSAAKIVLDWDQVTSVKTPGFYGEMTILPQHASLITELGSGILEAVGPTGTERFYVSGGFAEVKGDTLTVLPDTVEKPTDVNSKAAEKRAEELVGLMGTSNGGDELDAMIAEYKDVLARAAVANDATRQLH
jgi:F-type H+-transporting ATPase subunit epsilon